MEDQVKPALLPRSSDDSRVQVRHSYIARTLCVLVLALGVFTALTTARIVLQTYSPVIYWDQWSTVASLLQSDGHPTLSQLWAQHNEHRIPVGRLACYADLRFFGGRNISLLIGIYLVQSLNVLVFAWMIRRYSSFTPVAAWTAVGLILFCTFSPIQIENFIWGFEITFVMAGFAASVAFAAAIWYSEAAEQAFRPGRHYGELRLLLCILAAFVSECSLANGVLVWPILWLLAFTLPLPRRAQVFLGAAGGIAIAAYMKGYHSPPYHSDPLTSIQHPLIVGKYVITYFASTWDSHLPNAGLWPSVSETLTILAIAIALAGSVRTFMSQASASRFDRFLYADMLFVLMSATITALGRVTLGIGQATATRYQTIALVFWACFGLLLLSWVARLSSRSLLIAVQGCVLVLMMASTSKFGLYEKFANDRKTSLAKGYAALVKAQTDQEAMRYLYPALQELPILYQYLRAHNLGPDPRQYGGAVAGLPNAFQLAVIPGSVTARISGYRLVSPSRCSGFLDLGKSIPGQPGSFVLAGWAWDVTAEKPPLEVVLATSDGTIAGRASLGGSRPDVQNAVPQVNNPNTGWNASVQLPSGAAIHGFAVLADKKSACPLTNELRTP